MEPAGARRKGEHTALARQRPRDRSGAV